MSKKTLNLYFKTFVKRANYFFSLKLKLELKLELYIYIN